jgi:hypothetical protein
MRLAGWMIFFGDFQFGSTTVMGTTGFCRSNRIS